MRGVLVIGETSLGSWIKQQRIAHDLTQEELAGLTACSLSTIRKIEADQRRPSKDLAAQIARQLGLDGDSSRQFVQWVRAKEVEAVVPAAATAQVTIPTGQARGRGPTNLPPPATSFVGRAREVRI